MPGVFDTCLKQVHVKVKGQQAACGGGREPYQEAQLYTDPCGFIYSPNNTPIVTSITPSAGTYGDTIQINGTAFSSNVSVLFGEAECAILSVSTDAISCQLGMESAGPKSLSLLAPPHGYAIIASGIVLEYEVTVDGIVPNSGSTEGGTDIVITGTAFASYDNSNCSNEVYIGANMCQVSSSTYTEIKCKTSASSSSMLTQDVTVSVVCVGSGSPPENGTFANGFTYDMGLTPVISGISPTSGSGIGGETVTIMGSGFSLIGSENRVFVS